METGANFGRQSEGIISDPAVAGSGEGELPALDSAIALPITAEQPIDQRPMVGPHSVLGETTYAGEPHAGERPDGGRRAFELMKASGTVSGIR